jgi:hypothetical protein
MAFTRFHDDPARIRKTLEESTFAQKYYLNTPGNGVDMPFQKDPQMRLQGWGANLHSNAINLESDFRGLSRKLNHDLISQNNHKQYRAETIGLNYDNAAPFIDETRATHPAWMFRDLEQTRWNYSFHNVQGKTEIPFINNESTRILEKKNHVRNVPIVDGNSNTNYYLTGKSMCSGGNC